MESSSAQHRDLLHRVRTWKRVPALRLDLRFVRGTETGLFRVCDPKTQKFVELYELECLIAQSMDGERSSDDLAQIARSYNPAITNEQVEELVVQLVRLGMLEEEPIKPGHGKVIPLPVGSQANDEFSTFRNEIVLDLQRNEALSWSSGDAPMRRAPLFAETAERISHEDLDDGLLDNTALTAGSDPFAALERGLARHSASQLNPPPNVAPPKLARVARTSASQDGYASELDDDTVLTSANANIGDLAPLRREPPVRPTPQPNARPSLRPPPEPPPEPEPSPEPEPPPEPDEPPASEEPAQPASTPESVDSEQADVWNQSQAARKWYQRWWLRALVVLAVAFVVSVAVRYPLRVTAECAIVPSQRVYVRAAIAGEIAELDADEGTLVHKGDVIARLDDRDLQADKRQAQAELEKISAQLERAHHGARPEEISQQRAVLQARETAVVFAQKEAARRVKMLQEGVGSKQASEEAEADLREKQNAAAEASAALRLLVAGTRPEEIAALEAAQTRAKADLEFVEQKLRDMVVIRAPMDGVVLTPKLHEHLREKVDAGGLICEIADMSTARAEIFVPEREADSISVGYPVTVKVESYPLHPFAGTVDFIAPAVEARDGTSVLRVTAKLDNKGGLLRQDMTGYGEVECGRHTLFDLATRRLLRWIRVRFLI